VSTRPDEKELIAQAKAGCHDAFTALTERHYRIIYAFAYRTMGNQDDAEELTQATFTKAFVALPGTQGDMNLSAWLHRIATNQCLDVLRRRQRKRFNPWEDHKHEHLLVMEDRDAMPESSLIRSETDAMVQTVLSLMSEVHRVALTLRELDGLSCEEIGAIMGVDSRSAVKSRLHRSRHEFRMIWRNMGYDDRVMAS
jgi:RNA polymerase sigma-70 factor (ECF subfamily)